jgi:hypothetical protein
MSRSRLVVAVVVLVGAVVVLIAAVVVVVVVIVVVVVVAVAVEIEVVAVAVATTVVAIAAVEVNGGRRGEGCGGPLMRCARAWLAEPGPEAEERQQPDERSLEDQPIHHGNSHPGRRAPARPAEPFERQRPAKTHPCNERRVCWFLSIFWSASRSGAPRAERAQAWIAASTGLPAAIQPLVPPARLLTRS